MNTSGRPNTEPASAQRLGHPANRKTLSQTLQAAVDAGWLPQGTQAPEPEARPWPVLLLVALGAWLAAAPLMVVVFMLLGDFIEKGAGPYLIGALLITGAVVVLRSQPLPVFVEQLSLPALLVGGGALGMGLFRDFSQPTAAAILLVPILLVAAAVPRAWLRVLLGAAAGMLFVLACMPRSGFDGPSAWPTRWWLALHLLLLAWVAAGAAQARLGPWPRAALEPLRSGWLLVALAGLAVWSGLTMLVGASLGNGMGGALLSRGSGQLWQLWQPQSLPMQAGSMLLTLAAAAWVGRCWPTLRQPWCVAAALVLACLAGLMPALGAVLLGLAVSVTAARPLLAGAAALAAAWIVGASYYSLSWPLQHKALALVAAGAALGALAWWALQARRSGPAQLATSGTPAINRRPGLGLGMSAPGRPKSEFRSAQHKGTPVSVLAVLALANGGIWQKEQLIRHGQPVLVELAPVDPRSLMQGDYMTLRFGLPSEVQAPQQGLLQSQRPRVRLQRNELGVATLLPLAPGATLAPGELSVELTPKGGQWVLVTDAWFFAEGQAQRWSAARYGEFRVDGQGRALLVGLRDAHRRPL